MNSHALAFLGPHAFTWPTTVEYDDCFARVPRAGVCAALQFTTNEMAALFNVLEEWS
jgi:hypothetical protein